MRAALVLLLFYAYQNFNLDHEIKYELHNFRNNTDTIPTWIKKIYETENDKFLNSAIPSVIFFKKLSDSTSYCLYKVDDGVCLMTFVATQKNRKHFKKYEIGNDCDADFSIPEYSSTSFKHDIVNRIIRLTIHTERAKSKYLQKDGNFYKFKEGYDLENAETVKTSKTVVISINRNGSIIEQKK